MNRITLIGISLFLTHQSMAQDTMKLAELLSEVARQNPSLKMYDAEARSLEEAAKGAYSWMPPEAGAGFFMAPYDPGRIKGNGMSEGMGSFMLSAQQMFPNRRRQEAEATWMQSMGSVEKEKKGVVLNNLLYTVKKNYYEWIVLQKKLQVLNESERILDFMISSAEIRYKYGLGKLSAYYKAKAAQADVANKKLRLSGDIELKKIALNTLMYRHRNAPLVIDTGYTWRDFSAVAFDTAFLAANRSDVQVLERIMEVNNLQRTAELAKLKPEFGIKYDHMIPLSRRPWQFSLMAMVRLPLAKWSSKMNKAKAESLLWQNEALQNQREMILNDAAGMAGTAKTELDTRKNQMRLYETQIIPALRKNFQTMQLSYEQNTGELFELFDAWEALNMTQLEYLDQLEMALLMQAELERVLEIEH